MLLLFWRFTPTTTPTDPFDEIVRLRQVLAASGRFLGRR